MELTELNKPYTPFKNHIQNLKSIYEKALNKYNFEKVVIFSSSQKEIFYDDQKYAFKSFSFFNQWVPLASLPDSFVIFEPSKKPIFCYYQPFDYWHSTPQDPMGFWTDEFDIKVIRKVLDAEIYIKSNAKTLFLGEWNEQLNALNFKNINHQGVLNYLSWYRAYKSEFEIELMLQANKIGARAHKQAENSFFQGKSEFEIHIDYLSTAKHFEHELPYNNIVAINQNASILHHNHLSKNKTQNKSLLIDAGATYMGYCSDITRTYCHDKSLFADLIMQMNQGQLDIINSIQIGKSLTDLQRQAHKLASVILSQNKIINLSPEDILSKKLTRYFYPHGVSHLLGILVHDLGGHFKNEQGEKELPPQDYPSLRSTRKIENNFVFTVEPGLYFIDLLLSELKQSSDHSYVNWDLVDQLRLYGGIRIEDNIAIIDGQVKNMTREAFSHV